MTQNERIESLENKVLELENTLNHAFYMFLGKAHPPKSIFEWLEIAICEVFAVSHMEFKMGSFMLNGAFKRSAMIANSDLNEARKWMIVLSRYVLLKTMTHLKLEYHWYSLKNEYKMRNIFSGAIAPKTPQDFNNREILKKINTKLIELSRDAYENSDFPLLEL